MSVRINDDWRVDWDEHNWILQHRHVVTKGKREGETDWVNVGYYANEEQLSMAYASAALKEHNPDSLDRIRLICSVIRDELRFAALGERA